MAQWTRREALRTMGAATVGTGIAGVAPHAAAAAGRDGGGRIAQAVCRSSFGDRPFAQVQAAIAELGLTAVDMLPREEWELARDAGLTCCTGYGGAGTPTRGLNDPSSHDRIVRALESSIPRAARLGVRQIVAFVGPRRGTSDAEGLDRCEAVLRRLAPLAEDEGVTIVVELLNSRVDHPEYQADGTAFGVELVRRVGSPRVKLLYDVYHMQIMEGDIIRTLRTHREHIAHVQTGGVPGRCGLADRQELNWPAISRALVETGYPGHLAHEIRPAARPMPGLAAAVALCRV